MCKNRDVKRLRVVLLIAIVVTLGMQAFAYGFAGGTGEPNDPYQIATAEELISIGSDPNLLKSHFVLVNDLDLDPDLPGRRIFDRAVVADMNDYRYGFQGEQFTGSFDGSGYVIRNLVIVAPEKNYVGLFGNIGEGGAVHDLGLEGISITGRYSIGALAGFNGYESTISFCYAIGSVMGESEVGGLLGQNGGSVVSCFSAGDVIGDRSVGGLVGYNSGGAVSCYSDGHVTGSDLVGGLAGVNDDTISSCYSTGSVLGTGSAVGGLVGESYGFISSCYSTGSVVGAIPYLGGLVGDSGPVYLSYWDVQTSGLDTSVGGRGKTTAQMMDVQTFRGWGYDGHWTLDEGRDYPRLDWEGRPGRPIIDQPRNYGGGNGEPNDPYQIWTAEQLLTIGFYREDLNKCFILMADIDLASQDANDLVPIGIEAVPYTGFFDGAGHTISNLMYPFAWESHIGLFGYIGESGTVANLKLEGVQISGWSYVGGLAGNNNGAIQSCSVSGSVRASTGYTSWIGGLTGENQGTITSSYSTASVTGRNNTGGLTGENGGSITSCYATGSLIGSNGVGGLVGENSDGAIFSCYASGYVIGSSNVGGLVGENSDTISSCYSTGSVVGTASEIGGLVGSNSGSLSFSYSIADVTGIGSSIGGLMGSNSGAVHLSYWDIETSGTITSPRGVGKTTLELMTLETFQGWGHEGQWTLDEGRDYPHLVWEEGPGLLIVDQPLTYGGGSGEPNDPYQIWTAEQLLAIGLYRADLDKHFVLVADIDLSAENPNEIVPIGTQAQPFDGVFDGAGHVIRNLSYPFASDSYVGLFGYVGELGTVANLTLEAVEIRGWGYVGGLAGFSKGKIELCSVFGTVRGSSDYVGGLVGYNSSTVVWRTMYFQDRPPIKLRDTYGGVISSCYSSGSVAGYDCVGGLVGHNREGTISLSGSTDNTTGSGSSRRFFFGNDNGGVGGLVGWNLGGRISTCYSTGDVTGKGSPDSFRRTYMMGQVGGLIGSSSGGVSFCFATGNVTGTGSYVGGLVGYCDRDTISSPDHITTYQGHIGSCYSTGSVAGTTAYWSEWSPWPEQGETISTASTVGGLVGYSYYGYITSSFWDTETSVTLDGVGTKDPDPDGVVGKTTDEMQTATTFIDAGWDLTETWIINEGIDYPRFQWEAVDYEAE